MEQRPLRLGDLVDDYCPRERRITNHTIVALVDEAIKQTRCTTCDADHPYKGGKTPPRRKKGTLTSALYAEVLANATGGQLVPPEPDRAPEPVAAAPQPAPPQADENRNGSGDADAINGDGHARPDDQRDESWAAHRPLIRATLPKTDNDPPPIRPIPEFTMHQRNARGGHSFRQGFGWPDRGGAGRNNGNGFRGPAGAPGNGPGGGGRPGPGQGRRRHGKRRPPR